MITLIAVNPSSKRVCCWCIWLIAICFLYLATTATAQQLPRRQWDRVLGGDGLESFQTVQPTTDGGYIVGGTSGSGVSGDKTQPSKGNPAEPSTNYDYWLVKLDAAGNKQWDRAYGGNDTDALAAVQQTTDGGYIMGGYSVSPVSGDRSAPAKHGYWVVKVDAQGVKQWDKSFSNQSLPYLNALQQTADGGYILGGYSLGDLPDSPGQDDQSGPNRGGHDFWVIKLDAAGNKQWDRALGGTEFDFLNDVRQTADGGYLVGGTSTSGISGDKTQTSRGGSDYWVVKLDARGATQWDRTYGGAGSDALYSLCQTLDGGYILAGQSGSDISGDKTQAQQGGGDYWILKVDAQGRKLWDRSFGGSGTEQPNRVWPCSDGGFLVAGQSDSGISGDKSKTGFGRADYWLVKLNAAGTKEWDEVYGGSNLDFLQDARPTPDGGFILGGTSYSGTSCGKTQDTWGSADYWIIKLGTVANSPLGIISGDTLLCGTSPSLLRLKTVVAATSYQWSTGATTASIAVTQPGLYSASATLCDGTVATAQIRVAQVTAAVRGPASFCAGGTAALLADAPGATGFSWNTGQRTAAITVAQAGTYTVTATFPSGCSLTSSHTVDVPQVALSGDSLLCEGRPQQLTAATNDRVASYRWSTGATTASISVTQPGRYSVTATYANGCTSTATKTVSLIPRLPLPPPSTDTTVCETAEMVLRAPVARNTRATYRWSDNSTGSTLRVTQPGLYTLQVVTACQTIAVSWRVAHHSCVFIPNIVTANNDGVNDYFAVNNLPAGTWDLQVINRWGAQVYHAAQYRNEWGPEAIAGVYYYVLRNTKSAALYKGWVQIVR